MASKVVHFDKSVLEEYLRNPARSEYIHNMADLYRSIRDHMKACEKIAEEVFGENQCPDYIMAVHSVSVDFMSGDCGDSSEVEFVPDETVVPGGGI